MRLFILIFTGFIAPILLVALLVTNPLDFGGGKGLSPSQNNSNVEIVASIGGINITREEIDRAAEDNFETLIQVPEAQQAFFLSSLVAIQKIAARNAISEGLANSDAVQQRLAYQKEKILHDIWVAEQIHARVTENDIRVYFDTYVAPELAKQNENVEEVQAHHILVATQGEAETVIKRLEKGEDFAALAGELSLGPSASRGGNLGYFLAEEMVQAFSDAAFALQPGELSAPVETEFGWHVIRLEDRRVVPPPSFEDLSEQIRAFLEQQERNLFFDELLTSYDFQVYGEETSMLQEFDDDVPLND
ncbi:MAG: peptidylprolyl isomerase [Pseudomonadota bacterium]|nr:peptidylprolyl isomerase [Pseudomonadota bacterium]MEC9178167.1 peptidylprolyl isomerase [Pseudomonadota bacterium]MEE3035818.1 peptidylprolyl isomerase [Pseudomonadota bacterium]